MPPTAWAADSTGKGRLGGRRASRALEPVPGSGNLRGGSDEQRLDRRLRNNLRENNLNISTFGNVYKDPVGGIFGAGGGDVEALNSFDRNCRQQESVRDLNPGGVHQFRTHKSSYPAVRLLQQEARALGNEVGPEAEECRGGK